MLYLYVYQGFTAKQKCETHVENNLEQITHSLRALTIIEIRVSLNHPIRSSKNFKELWNISFIFCQICIARLYIIFWVFIRDLFASSECVFMFFLHVWKLVTLSGMDFRSVSYKVLGWPFWQWLFQLIFIKSARNIFHSWVFVSVRVVWAYTEFIELSDKRRQTNEEYIFIRVFTSIQVTSIVNCELCRVQRCF